MTGRTFLTATILGATVALGSAVGGQAQHARAAGIPNLAGRILTVRGPINPADAGVTSMHEHIFIEFKPASTAEGESVVNDEPGSPGPAAPAPGGSAPGGGGLKDFDQSLAEILEFKRAGGGTIVDVTNNGLSRNPLWLLRVSEASGLHVVMGAGWYMQSLHPRDMGTRTVEELTDILVRDVTVGAQGTTIRSGIIGEVGVGDFGPRRPLSENELKSVRASARAARLTGAPISIHSFASPDELQRVLDIIESEGVALHRVVMGHTGSGDVAAMKRFTDRGAYIEFDYTGGMPGAPMDSAKLARLAESRADKVKALIDAGLTERILLAQDVCTPAQLDRNGGGGFVFTTGMVIPALTARGVSDATIRTIMVDNPRRVLTFVAPASLVTP